jgi:glycosyltransferase involved in cell wall biosynthesis
MESDVGEGHTAYRTSGSQSGVKVAILLCTYHGQDYLAEQLDSIAAQTHTDWIVWASDDGSMDNTRNILDSYISDWGEERLSVHSGPGKGSTANFLSLTCHAGIEADYYAYADQDDIWEANKLQRAINHLRTMPENTPSMYCSRTRMVDAENHDIGLSPLFAKPPGFANALVQSLAGGNTMVFNNAARKLLQDAGEAIDVVIHDWWVYMVVSGCGGNVYYDPYPSLRYRQHCGNLIGGNSTWSDRLDRVRGYWDGQFREWNTRNIAALQRIRSKLTTENRKSLDQFFDARDRWLLPRLLGLKRSGVYRQTLPGNLGLFVAGVLKKI